MFVLQFVVNTTIFAQMSLFRIILRSFMTGLPISSIGPTTTEIISDSLLNTLYHLAAKQDFNVSSEFLDTTFYNSKSNYKTSRIPLGWDECSYGFTYYFFYFIYNQTFS